MALTVSNAPTGVALPSGAIAWWRAESNYLDSVGGNNGTAENGLGFAPGEVGSAFNVSNGQYLVVNPASPASLDAGQAAGFTFEEWIKPVTVSAEELLFEYERVLGTDAGTDTGIGFAIHTTSSGGILYANLVDTNFVPHEFASPANLLAAGVWQHVALTYDKTSGAAAIYLNGASVAVTNIGSITLHTSFTNLLLGARTTFNSVSSPGARYRGLIDESALYNRALASNEIAAIYAAGSNGKLATTSTNSIVSVAGVIDHFTWSQIASPRFANTPFTVTVQAKNSQNEVCSNFTGTAVLTTTNGVEVSPSVAASFSQGVWTGAAIISQPGTNLVLKASDNASHAGVANAITVAARPTLSLTPSNNSLVFSWPAEVSDFAVEATTNLSSGQWNTINATSSVVGNLHEQVLPISSTNQLYFRLRYTAP